MQEERLFLPEVVEKRVGGGGAALQAEGRDADRQTGGCGLGEAISS